MRAGVSAKKASTSRPTGCKVLQIVIAAPNHPARALYAALAEYAYKADNTRVGDLASAKAVSAGARRRAQAAKESSPRSEDEHSPGREGAERRNRQPAGNARQAERDKAASPDDDHGEPVQRPRRNRPGERSLDRADGCSPAPRYTARLLIGVRGPAGHRGGGIGLPVRAGGEHRLLPPVLHGPDRRALLPAHRVLSRGPAESDRSRPASACGALRRRGGGAGSGWTGRSATGASAGAWRSSSPASDHCLLDLLWRWRRGELDAEVVAVISNHDDLSPRHGPPGVPFHHVPCRAGRQGGGRGARCSSCWRARPTCWCSPATCRSSAATS